MTRYKRNLLGCWTCRKRKIKCDYLKPHCGKCAKSKLKCEGFGVKLCWLETWLIEAGGGSAASHLIVLKSSESKRSCIEFCDWKSKKYSFYNDLELDIENGEFPFSIMELGCAPKAETGISTPSCTLSELIEKSKPVPFPASFNLVTQGSDSHSINSYLIDSIRHFNHNLQYFLNITNNLNLVPNILNQVLGNYLINKKPIFELLLFSVILCSKLLQSTELNDEIAQLYLKTKSLLETENIIDLNEFITPLLLVLLIKINASLGQYDGKLFGYEFNTNNPLITLYNFQKSINNLLNYSQYKFNDNYKLIYQDILDAKYNLLSEFEAVETSPWNISISTKETNKSDIRRIPKYYDEEDDEDDDEFIPPTFKIDFSLNRSGGSGASSGAVNSAGTNGETKLFNLNPNNKTISIIGISNHLLDLFQELSSIINHKRYFNEINETSRNFPKLIAEFQELILNFKIITRIDDFFYNLLIILFYKLVLNFPLKLLTFHYKKLELFVTSLIKSNNELILNNQLFNLVLFVYNAFSPKDNRKAVTNRGQSLWSSNWTNQKLMTRDNYGDWLDIVGTEIFI